MASKRPHPQGPMDHLSPQANKGAHDVPQETPEDDKKHSEQAHQMNSNMARKQDGDRSKRQSAEIDGTHRVANHRTAMAPRHHKSKAAASAKFSVGTWMLQRTSDHAINGLYGTGKPVA